MPIGKYQLFPHNSNIEASVWLLFMKNKIMPTRHNSTISKDKEMLLYCIIEEILMNVDEIICEHILEWVKHPHNTRPFSYLIE